MAHNNIPVGKGPGWHQESMRHSMAAKGIKTGNNLTKEQFQAMMPEWKEGRPRERSTELFIPKKVIWKEGARKVASGELPADTQTTFAVRAPVYRKRAYKAGGMIAESESYVPRKYLKKIAKTPEQKVASSKRAIKKDFEKFYLKLD